ncbi:MAG: nucleotidyltransferase family protein [Rickettsiales bacterium]|nr:nucleotidyltransferase family protein [Rickettsiales bacterium]
MMAAIPHTAMVFAAGFGTRMQPITHTTPKPLVSVAGKTLLDWRLDALAKAGVKRAVVNTHHLGDQVKEHLSARDDMEIIISHEEEILETGGGMVQALPYLGSDPIFVVNSDVIWLDESVGELTLQRMADAYEPETTDMLLLLQPVEKAWGYKGNGDFNCTEDGRLFRKATDTHRAFVFTGLQIFNPEILAHELLRPFSLSDIFLKRYQPDGLFACMRGLIHSGAWLHIDSPQSLEAAETFLSH